MIHFTHLARRVKSILPVLAVALLTTFTASDAKESPATGSMPKTNAAAKPAPSGTFKILGPDVISCGQSVTLTLEGCYCNYCIVWYYGGTYTVTNNGSLTFTADGNITSVTAIEHDNCSPSGQVYNTGVKTFTYTSGSCN